VKYLGLYLIGGADFKIDLTAAWLCIMLNHIACHSSCMDVKFGH